MVSLAEAREYAYWDAGDDLSQRVLDGIHAEVNRKLPDIPSGDILVLKLWALYVSQWSEDEPVNLLEERDRLYRSFGWAPSLSSVQDTGLSDTVETLEQKVEALENRPVIDPTLEARVWRHWKPSQQAEYGNIMIHIQWSSLRIIVGGISYQRGLFQITGVGYWSI